MACAIIEHYDGRKTRHSGVVTASLVKSGRESYVRLLLQDGTTRTFETGAAVLIADDPCAQTLVDVRS